MGSQDPRGGRYSVEEAVTAMEDQILQCRDCGTEFVFTTGEQQFYESKGFYDDVGRIVAPRRCVECRNAYKRARVERLNTYQ